MLPLSIQISSSKMIPIQDIHYIYEIARCMKCSMYVLLRGTLYGFPNDCCCIHEFKLPFVPNTDLIFYDIDKNIKDVMEKYNEFFIPEKFPWIALPSYYWDMYINGDIEGNYNNGDDKIILIDKTTLMPIDQIALRRYRQQDDFNTMNMMEQLEGYFYRTQRLYDPIIFHNMENHPIIRKIYDNRANIGRQLLHLESSTINVAMYLYKGLFSLNKLDSLDIEVRMDSEYTNTFMATFTTTRKKNPIKLNNYSIPEFKERIHTMFMNLI